MEGLLRELVGREVVVYSGETGGYRDHGKLEAVDDRWIKVIQKNGEPLFFSIAMVRLVKPEE